MYNNTLFKTIVIKTTFIQVNFYSRQLLYTTKQILFKTNSSKASKLKSSNSKKCLPKSVS